LIEISVIIPTYNRLEKLQACLDSLGRQSISIDKYEVIVVVDGSTDGTQEYLAGLATPFKVTVICLQNQGQSVARNRGAEKASGQYLLFIDDDMVASRELIREHLQGLSRHKGHVALGNMTLLNPDYGDWYTKAYADAWKQHYVELANRSPEWRDLFGGNVSMERTLFRAVGGFTAGVPHCNDIEFGYRFHRQGTPFVYLASAIATHTDHKTWRQLIAESDQKGAAMVDLIQRHPSLLKELAQCFRIVPPFRRLALCGLLRLDLPVERVVPLCGGLIPKAWRRRCYKILQQYIYWRGVKRALEARSQGSWAGFSRGVPILMYHAFSENPDKCGRYIISARRFRQQLRWLYLHKYRVIGLEEYARMLESGQPLSDRTVVMTIDDGYAEVITIALPLLQRLGFSASFFLPSNCIGGVNCWDSSGELAGRKIISWHDAKTWLSCGMDIGAHTRNHPCLPELTAEKAQAEIEGSRKDIESNLGVRTLAFSYPYGAYNDFVMGIAEKVGYCVSCSVEEGLNHPATPPHALRRVEIRGGDPLWVFILKVRFGTIRTKLAQTLRRLCRI